MVTTNRAERHQRVSRHDICHVAPLCVGCDVLSRPNRVVRPVTQRCIDHRAQVPRTFSPVALVPCHFLGNVSYGLWLYQVRWEHAERGCSSLDDRLFWLPPGGTMRTFPLPECLGTVVVHRGDAVTCTRDSCPRDLSLESWFSHHASFMTCKAGDCPHCVFDSPETHLGYRSVKPKSNASRRRW